MSTRIIYFINFSGKYRLFTDSWEIRRIISHPLTMLKYSNKNLKKVYDDPEVQNQIFKDALGKSFYFLKMYKYISQ